MTIALLLNETICTHLHTLTHSDGSEVVVKVFAKHDPLLQLAPYEKKLHGTYNMSIMHKLSIMHAL